MKKIIFLLTAFCSGLLTMNAQINAPQPSPLCVINQSFGFGKIELKYARPSLNGRPVFQENSVLAPLNKLWRFGANASTKIKFTDKVMIDGKNLDSGTYSVFMIPKANEWVVIFNKNLKTGGTDGYKESEDVLRVSIEPTKILNPIETFSLTIQDISDESCHLRISWGNLTGNVIIKTEVTNRLRGQIEEALKADKVNPSVYQTAANFYFEKDKNYAKALENVNKGIENNKKAFWLYLLQGKIYKAMGDKANAKLSAENCIRIATEAKNDEYVRNAQDLINSLK